MDAPDRCPECGTELPTDGPAPGPCPACLLKLGLSGAIPRVDEPPVATIPPPAPAPPPVLASRQIPRIAGALAGAAAAVAALGLAYLFLRSRDAAPSPPEARLSIVTPETSDPISLAMSPDGRHIAFVGEHESRPHIWLRPLASLEARPLFGTAGATQPFWSPDSRHLGFFAGGELRRIGIDGGSGQALAPARQPCGGAWAADGVIFFVPDCDGAILSVPAAGGEPAAITSPDRGGETAHRFPQLLPDGDRILFFADGNPTTRGVYVMNRRNGERQRLLAADASAVSAPQGYLLVVRQGTLVAQPFDHRSLELGEAAMLAEQVAVDPLRRVAAVSASAAGPIVYRTGPRDDQRRLGLLDREGRMEYLAAPGAIAGPSVSPDGRRIAYSREVNGNTDIWLLDVARQVASRLSFDPATDTRPVWSPDGRFVVYQSSREGTNNILRKAADGSGAGDLLFAGNRRETVTDWSRDGRFLVFHHRAASGWDISAMPLDGDRKPIPIAQSPFDEAGARFSPDGRWIAYQANESDRFEIFVRSFPGGETRAQVTSEGGTHARWSRDGRTLFYVAPDGALMGVNFRAGSSIQIDRPFQVAGRFRGLAGAVPSYDVTANGGFVVTLEADDAPHPLTVLLNWTPPR